MSRETKKKPLGKYLYKGRYKLHGTSNKPRLSVFRSNNHIYAQLIDDTNRRTIISSSTLEKHLLPANVPTSTCAASVIVGHNLAEKSLKANITKLLLTEMENCTTVESKLLQKLQERKDYNFKIYTRNIYV